MLAGMPAVDVRVRAARHAALGDPARLAIVDDLAASDRAPKELAERHRLPSNLLAHHLDVLASAGLIQRLTSSGDRRRRYIRLVTDTLPALGVAATAPHRPMVFVCTHNSARSQLAAALWKQRTGQTATSGGTHPAERVHRGAIAAARRIGLDLSAARPSALGPLGTDVHVVTVCDQAHEELDPGADWWHWSLPDPVGSANAAAFDAVVTDLQQRISRLLPTSSPSEQQ
jgi:ArsR family transcriptional regulator, arsenate/arsenite/antimonite-responsive transcriptional repressor / arsenate reductase (thioredoxin)